MNLPSEFEQAVKYVMPVWPGSRPETESESETVFSLHAYIKKISQRIQQFTKLPLSAHHQHFPHVKISTCRIKVSEDKIKKSYQ